jgi:hypothetical protein
MSTPQEYWDACLIKTWRNYGSYLEAVNMFESITGINLLDEHANRTILRTPKKFFPHHSGIRIFVAQFLPKISDRLFDQPPEKDVLLLKKLSTSKYDVEEKAYTNQFDNQHKNQARSQRINQLKVGMSTQSVSSRNQATDWNVVKGSAKIRRRK